MVLGSSPSRCAKEEKDMQLVRTPGGSVGKLVHSDYKAGMCLVKVGEELQLHPHTSLVIVGVAKDRG